MARRIVIACEHGMTEPHGTRGGWVNPTCSGGRVLDPGSYVEVWWCKDCGMAAEYRSDLACPHADVLPEAILVVVDALAGGEQP